MPRHLPLPKGNEKVWRDLLPPEPLRKHGRHVYLFRNTQTNQILYTLYPRIEQRTLRQLPFIGKKSQPARVRPDLWTAHCRVGPFPTASQGLNALKKLREFRKLHETCWNQNNPEWSKEPRRKLIRLIMNQRENATADLAKVLAIQEEVGVEQIKEREARKKQQEDFLNKRWNQLEEMAKAVAEGSKIKVMEKKLRDCKAEKGNKLGDDAEVRRLDQITAQVSKEMREMRWAQRIVEERNKAETLLLRTFKRETKKAEELRAKLQAEGKAHEADRIQMPKMQSNPVRMSMLPPVLKSKPQPFSLRGIECQWADLHEAEFAGENWPATIVHAELPAKEILTYEEYNDKIQAEKQTVDEETKKILDDLVFNAENERRVRQGLEPLSKTVKVKSAAAAKPKTGIAKYLPSFLSEFKNPFKRQPSLLP